MGVDPQQVFTAKDGHGNKCWCLLYNPEPIPWTGMVILVFEGEVYSLFNELNI